MRSTGSLFLTKSRHGIWYYQRWIPTYFRKYDPSLNKIFRVSLRTRHKGNAKQLSRLLSVKIDELALQFFDNPRDFGKAMELLHRSAKAWEDYSEYLHYEEHFLCHVEEGTTDEFLFRKAGKYERNVRREFEKLEKEVSVLRKVLLNGSSVSSPKDAEKFLSKVAALINPPLSDSENPTLTALFDKWYAEKKGTMQDSSLDDTYKPVITLFIDFINDLNGNQSRVGDLNVEDIRNFKEFCKNLPIRVDTKNNTITDLIRLSGNPRQKSSPVTLKGKYANIGAFLKWILTEGYPIQPNLHSVLTKVSKIPSKDIQKRIPLSDNDLKKIFSSKRYTETGKFFTSGMYWVPLIAIYTGARMSEILQLENHDIKKEGIIWTLNITDTDGRSVDPQKRVKKDGSRRKIPIHKTLIDLGFIDFVKTRKDSLFPDETRNTKGKFDSFQKRFATFLKQVDVRPEQKMEKRDFHSIRHTVRTKLTELRTTGKPSEQFDEGIIDAIVGHASKDRSIGQTTYNHSQYVEAQNNALNRLEYTCIELKKIKRWDTCQFGRDIKKELAKN